MSGLKYLVIVLFVETWSSPLPTRNVRNVNYQAQPSYGYPIPYPYQQPILPFQTRIAFPNAVLPPETQKPPPLPSLLPSRPIGNAQIYPINQQSYPFYMNLPYPSYPSFQPPNYPQGPYYPSYPSQSNFPIYPNYQDPLAHVPTEIIDVDDDGSFGPESSWEDLLSKIEVTNTHHASASELANPISNTQIIESKPLQTTITRTFDSQSSDPIVDVKYAGSSSNTGSGTLIAADESKIEVETNKEDKKEEKIKEDDDEDEKGGGLFSWGG